MLIDLSKLLTHEGKQQQVEIFPSGDTFSCELGEFSYGEKEPVKLTIKHKENQILNISAKGQVAVVHGHLIGERERLKIGQCLRSEGGMVKHVPRPPR